MLLAFTQNSVLFVVKRVETLRFDDLAITRGVNVFANCIKDQFGHLVAQFSVLASAFGDQNEIALGFEQRPQKFCCKCQVRGIHLPGVILARFHGFFVTRQVKRHDFLEFLYGGPVTPGL